MKILGIQIGGKNKIKTATVVFSANISFIISEEKIFIGRGDGYEETVTKTSNSLMITPLLRAVSKKHALLTKEKDGTYSIADQGSSYGTFVKGIKVEPGNKVNLNNKDQVTLRKLGDSGGVQFQIIYS